MNKYRFINYSSNIAIEIYADSKEMAWNMLTEEVTVPKAKLYSLDYIEKKDEQSFY